MLMLLLVWATDVALSTAGVELDRGHPKFKTVVSEAARISLPLGMETENKSNTWRVFPWRRGLN
ncbi:hypothetical protein E2562_039424 [Oryza meyeriana var. granulata]|uniref:Secreted protein n=1 Tax=Oryza meyeriana var. granulata TaxID=110450 RepID=A0A6G1CXZ9_9ORYZ|nr:hypothetical protein E2562_039424 [Oryza meyeriana var. granulata]